VDRIPPSACPTGIYRPPSRPPALADVSRPPTPADRRATVGPFGALRALVRYLLGGCNARSEQREISRG